MINGARAGVGTTVVADMELEKGLIDSKTDPMTHCIANGRRRGKSKEGLQPPWKHQIEPGYKEL